MLTVASSRASEVRLTTSQSAECKDYLWHKVMDKPESNKSQTTLRARYKQLSTGKKVIIIVFLIWLIQAFPKWIVAVTADGELSAKIMKIFITPGY